MSGKILTVRARVDGTDPTRPRLDVSLEVGPGITVIMGPSGAGKTTLLTTIAGLCRPTSGYIALDDHVFYDSNTIFTPPHLRRIALVFQSLALFSHMSVWENVAYGAPHHVDRKTHAKHWLERAHVAHLLDRTPSTLSGGEAQRVAIARALASLPKVLLLDEPFTALDPPLRTALSTELADLIEDLQIPTILVTHDAAEAQKLGTRIHRIEAGRIIS